MNMKNQYIWTIIIKNNIDNNKGLLTQCKPIKVIRNKNDNILSVSIDGLYGDLWAYNIKSVTTDYHKKEVIITYFNGGLFHDINDKYKDVII